jgi:hypothetical protein
MKTFTTTHATITLSLIATALVMLLPTQALAMAPIRSVVQVVGDLTETLLHENPGEFTIRTGLHDSVHPLFKKYQGDVIAKNFKFDNGAIYTTRDPANQNDGNKLFGSSDCGKTNPEDNSARFTWHWDPKQNAIVIMAQVDHNGTHYFHTMGTTEPNAESVGTILVKSGSFEFYYKGVMASMPRFCSSPEMYGYRQYPYFGGQETAPHTIHIWLKDADPDYSVASTESSSVEPTPEAATETHQAVLPSQYELKQSILQRTEE